MNRFTIDMWYYIVRLLPKRAVYFSYIYVLSHSTTGKYENEDTDEFNITAINALERWYNDYEDEL
jgi:hypothetical protein